MKTVFAIVLFVVAACALGPTCLLARVAWQDRKLTNNHPDYLRVWGGKRIVPFTMLGLIACDSLLIWGGVELLR